MATVDMLSFKVYKFFPVLTMRRTRDLANRLFRQFLAVNELFWYVFIFSVVLRITQYWILCLLLILR